MGRNTAQGDSAVGRDLPGSSSQIASAILHAGAVPPTKLLAQPAFQGNRLFWEVGKLAVRVLALSLATPAAAESGPAARDLLTSGPEPVNLVGFGLALAVLFLFRRFSRTS